MKNDSLGDRMKGYEGVSKYNLTKRMPVIFRIDGKAFHTWTKQLNMSAASDPFSVTMNHAMTTTTEGLVKNIQNAVLGYTQSDEISILLNDWKTLTTDQWFGNSVQKMASVSASMATAYFNEAASILATWGGISGNKVTPAMFDARVFNIPKEEVANYFVWRQQDATRNSIQMLGQHYFSHKELQGKNVSQVQDMLMLQHGVNWNDTETWKKRGTCVTTRHAIEMRSSSGLVVYDPVTGIYVDREIPIFTQDRDYIEKLLEADEV